MSIGTSSVIGLIFALRRISTFENRFSSPAICLFITFSNFPNSFLPFYFLYIHFFTDFLERNSILEFFIVFIPRTSFPFVLKLAST